jgi:hypothetical protein
MPFLGFLVALAPFVCVAIAVAGIALISAVVTVVGAPMGSFVAAAGAGSVVFGISRIRS